MYILDPGYMKFPPGAHTHVMLNISFMKVGSNKILQTFSARIQAMHGIISQMESKSSDMWEALTLLHS